MPCCGNARRTKSELDAPQRETLPIAGSLSSAIMFQYLGKTRLAVAGGVTRQIYRFDSPGARMMVDSRDANSLSALPMLRRI